MRWLVEGALRLRVLVVALAVLVVILGIRAAQVVPLDVFPEFAPPLVEIQTEAPGLSALEVEQLVTVPLEQALNGTSFVTTVRSKSVLGLSSVVLLFARGTDLMTARQLTQERVGRVAATLPAVARPPVMLSPLSSLSRVLKIGITSKSLSQIELTTLAKWTIRPRLMAVPGVANVAIWGQRDRQLQVLVDPDRLASHGLSIPDVERATGEAVAVGAGGFIDGPNQRLSLAHRGHVLAAGDLARATVAFRDGAPLHLGAVAEVTEGSPPPIGDAIINDGPGLLLIVEKQPWGNTLTVTQGVEAALASLGPSLGDVQVDPTIFRPATFIEMSLRNLNRALLIGCVLVVVVLGFFLANWRTALISVLAIPLSLSLAMLILGYRGGTLDTMVLAGLVIALGEIVDDAIIDVENIARRLRLNRLVPSPRSAFAVVLDASLEVRSAVVYASLIVILIFLPVYFLGGLAGTFFRPLALSYTLAIASSLLVALLVTPVLCLLLLRGVEAAPKETRFLHWLRNRYRALLPAMLDRSPRLIPGLAAVLVVAVAVGPFLGQEFLPRFKEYDFLMHWVEKPGTSLDAMRRITIRASQELRAIPGVRNFGAHLGRAEVADEVVGANFTELWVSIDPKVDYDATVATIQAAVDGYPGLVRDLLTYLRERIKEVLSGTSATLVVRLFGPDLDSLRSAAAGVAKGLGSIPGIADLKVQQQVLVPHIAVRFRPELADRYGFTAGEVRRQIATLVRGTKVGEIYDQQQAFDVVVWGVPGVRRDLVTIRDLRLASPTGGLVPLSRLADVAIEPTPNEITREGASRKLDITANVRGRDLGSVAQDVERAVRAMSFPAGTHPEFLGEYQARQEASRSLMGLALFSLIGIFLILQVDFGSTRMATLVFASLPFALIGGVAAVLVSGGSLSLGSLVGFVTVLGIAARNGIMLVSHYRHLEQAEGMPFGRELVVRGAEERLSPILMTALATGLALVPLIAAGSRPGHEIEHPMAVVILGGLITSTLLNLFLMPALYLRFGRPRA
ncbi:MAG: efflux RND transporter permease subunit [Gemmatimonadales bacterium]